MAHYFTFQANELLLCTSKSENIIFRVFDVVLLEIFLLWGLWTSSIASHPSPEPLGHLWKWSFQWKLERGAIQVQLIVFTHCIDGCALLILAILLQFLKKSLEIWTSLLPIVMNVFWHFARTIIRNLTILLIGADILAGSWIKGGSAGILYGGQMLWQVNLRCINGNVWICIIHFFCCLWFNSDYLLSWIRILIIPLTGSSCRIWRTSRF